MTAALLAAFPGADPLLRAAHAAVTKGVRPLDAFTPYPVPDLDEALALRRPNLPWVMLAAGLAVAAALYGLQVWSATQGYPFNTGGRPLHSWPTFLIASVELGILAAGVAGFVCLLIGGGLPMLHHPLFDSLAFERASQDQFVLALPRPSADEAAAVRSLLFDAGAVWVEEMEL